MANDIHTIARAVLKQQTEARRLDAVARRQYKDDLQRLTVEAEAIGDELVNDCGLVRDSPAYFTAMMRVLAARHLHKADSLEARLFDTGF